MSDAPGLVFIGTPDESYVWIDLNGVALEVKPPDSIDFAFARGQAAKLIAQIESGIDSALEWGTISAEEAEEEEARAEIRDLVIAVKLAKRITRRWNACFERDAIEAAPLDEHNLRRLFRIPRMIEAFWVHVLPMGATIEPIEGNDFAAGQSGDMATAAKPADSASSKERDALLEAETASQESDAPKKRTRRKAM